MHAAIRSAIVGVFALTVTACDGGRDRPAEIDLLSELPKSERRAPVNPDEAVRAGVVGVEGDMRTALVLRSPARVTWTVWLPLHARLTSAALLVAGPPGEPQGVTVRIGLSDRRRYTELTQVNATGKWMPLTLDLRKYSEWKFSLFDQPLRNRWQLIVNVDATPGGTAALDRPRLTRS